MATEYTNDTVSDDTMKAMLAAKTDEAHMDDADSGVDADGTRFRASGFNSPETDHGDGKSNVHPDGELSSELTEKLMQAGAEFKPGDEKGTYGRELRRFEDADGRDLAAPLIESGMAFADRSVEGSDAELAGIVNKARGVTGTGHALIDKYAAMKSDEEFDPTANAEMMGKNYDRRGTFSKSFDRGIEQGKEALGGALNYIGDAIGSKDWQEAGREYQESAANRNLFNNREVESYQDIDSIDKAFAYVIETTGEMAPSLIMDAVITAGTAGTGLGFAITRRAGVAALRNSVKNGVIAGPLVSGYLQAAGDMENRLDEADAKAGREGETHGLRSTISGLVGGAVELAPLAAIAGDILKASGAKKNIIDAVVKATDEGAKKSLLRRSVDVGKDISKTASKGAVTEGSVESIQAILDEATFSVGNKNEWTLDAQQLIDATLRGVAGGGAMAGTASTSAHTVGKIADEYNIAVNQAKREQGRGKDWQEEKSEMEQKMATGEISDTPIDRSGKKDADDETLKVGDVVKGAGKTDSVIKEGNTGKETFTSQDVREPNQEMFESLDTILRDDDGKVLPWSRARKMIGRHLDPSNPRSPQVTEDDMLQYMASRQHGAGRPVAGNYDKGARAKGLRAKLKEYVDASFMDNWGRLMPDWKAKKIDEDGSFRPELQALYKNKDATAEDLDAFFTKHKLSTEGVHKGTFKPDIAKTWSSHFGMRDEKTGLKRKANKAKLLENGFSEEAAEKLLDDAEAQVAEKAETKARASKLNLERQDRNKRRDEKLALEKDEEVPNLDGNFTADNEHMLTQGDDQGLSEMSENELFQSDGKIGVKANFQRRKAQAEDSVMQLSADKDLMDAGILDYMDNLVDPTPEEKGILSEADLTETVDSKRSKEIVFGDEQPRNTATGKGNRTPAMTRKITPAEKKRLLEALLTKDKAEVFRVLSSMRLIDDIAETGDSERAPAFAIVLAMINRFRGKKRTTEKAALADEISMNESEKLIGKPVTVNITYPNGDTRQAMITPDDITRWGAPDVGLDINNIRPDDKNFLSQLANAFHAGLSKIQDASTEGEFEFSVDFNDLREDSIIFQVDSGKGYTYQRVKGAQVNSFNAKSRKMSLRDNEVARIEAVIDALDATGQQYDADTAKRLQKLLDAYHEAVKSNLKETDQDTYKDKVSERATSLYDKVFNLKFEDVGRADTGLTLAEGGGFTAEQEGGSQFQGDYAEFTMAADIAAKEEEVTPRDYGSKQTGQGTSSKPIKRSAYDKWSDERATIVSAMRAMFGKKGTDQYGQDSGGGGINTPEYSALAKQLAEHDAKRPEQDKPTHKSDLYPQRAPRTVDGEDVELGSKDKLTSSRQKLADQSLGRRSVLTPVVKALHKVLGTVRSRLERFNPTLADALFTRSGDGQVGGSFERSSRFMYEQKLSQFNKRFTESPERIQAAWDDALDGKPKTLRGQAMLKFMNDFHDEIRESNPDYKGEGISFVFDTRKIDSERRGFLAILEKHGITQPQEFMEQLLDARGSTDHAIVTGVSGVRGTRRKNAEVKKAMADLRKGNFIEGDAATAANRFLASGSAFAQWSRVFGAKDKAGKFNESMFFDHLIAATPPEHLDETMKLVSASLGRVSQVPHWVNKLNSTMFAFHAGTILWFSGVASIPELATVVSRSRGDVDGILKSVIGLAKSDNRKHAEALARSLETVSRGINHESLMNLYSSGELTVGKTSEKISSFVFKANGQEFITKLSRTFATSVGKDYVEEHLMGAMRGDQKSFRALKELGIGLKQVSEVFKAKSKAGDGQMDYSEGGGKLYRDAIHQFVDESVSNPHASQMPLWMNDPRWQLVASLKKFFYAFWDNFHRQMHSEYGKRRGEQVSIPRAVLPMALAAVTIMPLAMLAEALREFIKYPFGLGKREEFSGSKWVLDSIHATGGLGPMQMAQAAYEQTGYGRNMAVSLGGPTLSMVNDLREGNLNPSRFMGPVNQHPWARSTTDKAFRDMGDWFRND